MLAEQQLKAGKPEEALASLQDLVRKEPNNPKYRTFLFQLLSVLGRWERALVQLKVAGDLDPEALAMVQTYREALKCEVLRTQVFAGQRTPVFFGEAEEWMAFLVQALNLTAEDKHAQAEAIRARAFEAAPTTSGRIDGKAFEWIADGDMRLGPTLEVVLNGHYNWVPFRRIQKLRVEAPADLRDMVWMPAWLTLQTGAELPVLVPARYPGSESASDDALRMARRTDWQELPGGYVGTGQRVLMTDAGEHPLLDVRLIELDTPTVAAAPEATEQPASNHG